MNIARRNRSNVFSTARLSRIGLSILLLALLACRSSADDLGPWIATEQNIASTRLLRNLLSDGAVIASPSTANPDYYYHWVRDGALTMDVVVSFYAAAPDQATRDQYLALLTTYLDFSRALQTTNNPSSLMGRGLGEPKFITDGSPYLGNWGRPQDDGPALRAASLCRLANLLLDNGRPDLVNLVKSKLYDSVLPTNSLIKSDLEYVSHNWNLTCVDLWEESSGDHFYTKIVQRRALREGAKLATRLSDPGAAQWYSAQSTALETAIQGHWDPSRGILVGTLNQQGPTDQNGNEYKTSGLDVAVVLGVLHASFPGDDFFAATDDQVLATTQKLVAAFNAPGFYNINGTKQDAQGNALGPAIGRYPEDRYYGGNPWFLCTGAIAELYYRAANLWDAKGTLVVSAANKAFFLSLDASRFSALQPGQTLTRTDPAFTDILSAIRNAGDAELWRIKYHTAVDGSLSEQMNRDTGFEMSAADLTWSYASILTAAWQRQGTTMTHAVPPPAHLAASLPEPSGRSRRLRSIPSFAKPLNRAGVPVVATQKVASRTNRSTQPADTAPNTNPRMEQRLSRIEKAINRLSDELKSSRSNASPKAPPK
jgi:glucoamylase